MTFGKRTLFSFMLGVVLLANIFELTHSNFLSLTTLISCCAYIVVPGFLISLILRIKRISFWENLSIIVGLSIAFLETGGLLLNILLPLCGVKDPLAWQNLVLGFSISIFLLFPFAWIRTEQFSVKFQLPRRSKGEKVLYILPLFFPVFATLGAIILNNGGSDILTLILLGAIAAYSLLLVLVRNKIAVDLYPYAIFFSATATLFTTSLRSWYTTGHDVAREFYVFQLTNTHHLWSMALYQDAYNACLSITILPTVLTNLLSVQDAYVYKVIFQLMFATAPILVFFIIRNYAEPALAFLSAFFFMAFPTFFNDMPMLNRQEIGFIFFGLVLYMMLLPELSFWTRRVLFIIFTLSTVISHYSTNFVVLALLTTVYILMLIAALPLVKKPFMALVAKSHRFKNAFPYAASNDQQGSNVELQYVSEQPTGPLKNSQADRSSKHLRNKMVLSLPLIVLLFGMTYVWDNLYTNTSKHVGVVLAEVVTSMFVKSSPANKSGDVAYSIFASSAQQDPKKQLQAYVSSVIQTEKSSGVGNVNNDNFYSLALTSKYPSYPLPQELLAPTPLGSWLSSLHISVFDIQAELRSLSASFIQIFVFIGLLAMLFFNKKKPFDLQYLLLCFSTIFLLALIIILPALSVEYGLLRMFQQFLFLLSLPVVRGIYFIFSFVKEPKRMLFTGIVAIIFFLNLAGFLSHLTGDYYPQLTLDNAGLYYDAYYVHESDVRAVVWIATNNSKGEPVGSDAPGMNKLLMYGNIQAVNEEFPPLVRKDTYVYEEVSSNKVVSIDNDVVIYNSSENFLNDNKNLIYSNGKNNIYR